MKQGCPGPTSRCPGFDGFTVADLVKAPFLKLHPMERYLDIDPWKVVETGFHPERQRSSESIFSIGNGRFGQRANHEEHYSGDHHRGSYVGGVYYPDKTKVGWWKNGYPEEYFARS